MDEITKLKDELSAAQSEIAQLKETIKKQDKEYVLNGSIQDWKEYSERTTAIISKLKQEKEELRATLQKSLDKIRQALVWAEIPAEDRRQHYEFIESALAKQQ